MDRRAADAQPEFPLISCAQGFELHDLLAHRQILRGIDDVQIARACAVQIGRVHVVRITLRDVQVDLQGCGTVSATLGAATEAARMQAAPYPMPKRKTEVIEGFGARLAELRKVAGYIQVEFATELGATPRQEAQATCPGAGERLSRRIIR